MLHPGHGDAHRTDCPHHRADHSTGARAAGKPAAGAPRRAALASVIRRYPVPQASRSGATRRGCFRTHAGCRLPRCSTLLGADVSTPRLAGAGHEHDASSSAGDNSATNRCSIRTGGGASADDRPGCGANRRTRTLHGSALPAPGYPYSYRTAQAVPGAPWAATPFRCQLVKIAIAAPTWIAAMAGLSEAAGTRIPGTAARLAGPSGARGGRGLVDPSRNAGCRSPAGPVGNGGGGRGRRPLRPLRALAEIVARRSAWRSDRPSDWLAGTLLKQAWVLLDVEGSRLLA